MVTVQEQQEHQPQSQAGSVLRCSLFLELPDAKMEQAFWDDARTVRSFTGSDMFTSGHALMSNFVAASTLVPALKDPRSTWHIQVVIFSNIIACCSTLFLLLRRAEFYNRHRHKIAAANRLLRLGCMILTGWCASPTTQQALGDAMNLQPGGPGGRSVAQVALLNLTRPLYFLPMMAVAHGNWYFGAKYYIPLQLLTHLVACYGSSRYQPCRLACDPYASLVVQTTCSSVSQLHHLMVGSLLAPLYTLLFPPGSVENPVACSDVLGAARVLSWYSQAAYVLFNSGAALLSIEWTLKARWVHQQFNQQLVYGPFGWPRSQQGSDRFGGSWLQVAVAVVVMPVIGLALLWFFCLWLVPLLPHEPCTACDAGDTCPTVPHCEGLLCQDTGMWAALVMYAEMVSTFFNLYMIMRCLAGLF